MLVREVKPPVTAKYGECVEFRLFLGEFAHEITCLLEVAGSHGIIALGQDAMPQNCRQLLAGQAYQCRKPAARARRLCNGASFSLYSIFCSNLYLVHHIVVDEPRLRRRTEGNRP